MLMRQDPPQGVKPRGLSYINQPLVVLYETGMIWYYVVKKAYQVGMRIALSMDGI
jgi:hypothetical protein